MKKSILFTVLTFGILIFGFIQPKEEKLNFLFIIVDDLRPEIGTYGAKHIKSPNLDRFASQSAVFERSFCNIPVCGASRASLMSGIRPARNQFQGFFTKTDTRPFQMVRFFIIKRMKKTLGMKFGKHNH
jgi:iduronate 2-sulfatase